MQPKRLSRLMVLALAAALLATFAGGSVPARAAAITGIALDSFDCAGPAMDLTLTGDFTGDDGSGLDYVRIRVTDGLGMLLFDLIGGSSGVGDWPISIADATDVVPDPRANPIRVDVFEYARADPQGQIGALLASAAFRVPCLVSPTAPVGSPFFTGPRIPTGVARLPTTTRLAANVYHAPEAAARQIEYIPARTPLVLVGRDRFNQWALAVLPDGRSGWVSLNLLDVTLEEIQVLPVRR